MDTKVQSIKVAFIIKEADDLIDRVLYSDHKMVIALSVVSQQSALIRLNIKFCLVSHLSAMLMRQGMMTAGDTAARTKPSMRPTVRGKPMMK